MPFFIKPITRTIGSRVESAFLTENFAKHFGFLDSQLASSPDGGKYLCGKDLTAVRRMLLVEGQAPMTDNFSFTG